MESTHARTGVHGAEDWRQRLHELGGRGLVLLPIGAKPPERKAPVDPLTGDGLKRWQHHPGFTPADLVAMNPQHVIAAGVNTGHNGILVVDVDGATAAQWLATAGVDPKPTDTWAIWRDTDRSRYKLVFRLTPEQQQQFPRTKLLLRTIHGEALEIYHQPGAQVVVLGQHAKSAGHYLWVNTPADIATPSPAWMAVFQRVKSEVEALRRKGDTSRPPRVPGIHNLPHNSAPWSASGNGHPCPICARERSAACTSTISLDGRTIASCFHGSADHLCPQGLTAGQTITGRDGRQWAFIRTYIADCLGEKSLFIEHQDRPKQPPSAPARPSAVDPFAGISSPPPQPPATPQMQASHPFTDGYPDQPAVVEYDDDDDDDAIDFRAVVRSLQDGNPLNSQEQKVPLSDLLPRNLCRHIDTTREYQDYRRLLLFSIFATAVSGALPLDSQITLSPAEQFVQPLTLWLMMVMPSGEAKSPALRRLYGRHWTPAVQSHIKHSYETIALRKWTEEREAYDQRQGPNPGPMPVCPKTVISGDFTYQGLAKNAAAMEDFNWAKRSALISQDEGDDILSQTSDKLGKALRAFLLSAYDGNGYTSAKATAELNVSYESIRLSMIIGVQPEAYKTGTVGGDVVGFMGRFDAVEQYTVKSHYPDTFPADYLKRAADADRFFHHILKRVSALPRLHLTLSPAAAVLFNQCRNLIEEDRQAADACTGIKQLLNKEPGKLGRWTGVLHICEHLDGLELPADDDKTWKVPAIPSEVSEETLRRAFLLLKDYISPGSKAARVKANSEAAEQVAAFQAAAMRHGEGSIREIRKRITARIRPSANDSHRIAQALEAEGYGRRAPATHGRGPRYQATTALEGAAGSQG